MSVALTLGKEENGHKYVTSEKWYLMMTLFRNAA
jgi:hypothetical protein